MVFLDTCIWIELCGVKTPTKEHEKRQAQLASDLLHKLLFQREKIVTCNEQLVEIISAVEKIKLKEYNRNARNNGLAGSGDLKDFRSKTEFLDAKRLCESIVTDVRHFAEVKNCNYSVDDILSRIDLADINDCIYYDYCKDNGIEFYSFDMDISKLGQLKIVHILR